VPLLSTVKAGQKSVAWTSTGPPAPAAPKRRQRHGIAGLVFRGRLAPLGEAGAMVCISKLLLAGNAVTVTPRDAEHCPVAGLCVAWQYQDDGTRLILV
jgi:hypothetical protein